MKTIKTHNIKYTSSTLTEFIEMVRQDIDPNISNDDIVLYYDWNLYGERVDLVDCQLEVKIKEP